MTRLEDATRSELDLGRVAAPAAIDRPAPFWGWNEVLEPAEIRRQVRELARGGLGGAFCATCWVPTTMGRASRNR